jgi:hypothetical protein
MFVRPLRKILPAIGLIALTSLTGCVERRFVIESNVPGAQVYVNNVPVGPSPADARWDYAGKYEFRVVAQGYEPLTQVERVRGRWYDYPGLDFVAETLWPFHIEDVRRFRFDLQPTATIRTDELINKGSELRNQARQLPPPQYPETPRTKTRPGETPAGPVGPTGTGWRPPQ